MRRTLAAILWTLSLVGVIQAGVLLRVGTSTELEPLSPVATSGFWYGIGYTGLVHMPLITYRPPDARYGPCLAREWKIGADNLSITFFLAPGARWHDGREVTADDVAFTLEYLKEHEIIGQLWRFLERAEAIDRQTVKVRFTEPVAFYQSMFFPWPKILPRHIWAEVEDPENFQGVEAMVGCGPFALVRYDADARQAFLKRTPGFFAGETRIDSVQIRFFASTEALVLALKRGDIDLVMGPGNHIPQIYIPALEEEDGLELMEVDDGGVPLTMVFHYDKHPVRKRAFRRAVAHAVDSRTLIATVRRGRGKVPELGFVPPGAWTYGGAGPQLQHDPVRARALLDSLGFVDRDQDGMREDEKGGPMTLEIVPETWQAQGQTVRAVEMIVHQLGEVGIRAQMVKYVVEQEYEKLWEERDYQIYVGYATHAGVRDGGHVYFANYRDFSYGTFEDSTYLTLIDAITAAADEDAYLAAVRTAQQYNIRELPGLALIWGEKAFAFRRDRFRGWRKMASYGIPNYDSWFSVEPVAQKERVESSSTWPTTAALGILIMAGGFWAWRKARS